MSATRFRHTLKSPLARRLIAYMVAFSASVALLMTAGQIYLAYERGVAQVDGQFRQIGAAQLPSIIRSHWAANTPEIQLQLEGLLRLPHIVHASVEEGGQYVAEAGRRDAHHLIEHRYAMRIEQAGEMREIGTLTVAATHDAIHAELRREALGTLALNALHTFLVALFILALFYRLIARHLAKVAEHLGDADPAAPARPLVLARQPPGASDELDVLVNAVNAMQDKTRLMLDALHDSREQVRMLLDSTSEAIYGMDTNGVCTFANPACLRMLGFASEAEMVGKSVHALIHHSHRDGRPYPVESCNIHHATLAGIPHQSDDQVHWRADGTAFPVEYWSRPMFRNGEVVGSVVAFNDISERRAAEATLHRLAYYDGLTGLPNRQLFNDRLGQALSEAKRRGGVVALMLLDLDRFKNVNDTLGHEAGDALLREIALRLRLAVRANDTVARLGGDEFALIFTCAGEAQHVAQLAQKLLAQFAEPVALGGREIFTSASIGIALYPTDTGDADELLKYADSAMYHAKESGRNAFRFYSSELTALAHDRLQLETRLRRALEHDELVLHYQPLVDARSDAPKGVEALVRWRDGSGKLIPPAQFIPLAEETGLIVPIGTWVLTTACAQLRRWHDAGRADLTLSVNVASRQFHDAGFVDTVAGAIRAAGIPAGSLELEITETILLDNSESTLRTLNALKALGVTLAIDDFGTGYSSLGYLKRFPIDRVKIDRSFVQDLTSSGVEDLAIVRAIIALARAMQLSVIAEGVETVEQLALLQREDCHDYQGYFYARPMDAEAVGALLLPLAAAANAG